MVMQTKISKKYGKLPLFYDTVTIKYGNTLPYSNSIWQSNSQRYGNYLPYIELYGKLPYNYTIW